MSAIKVQSSSQCASELCALVLPSRSPVILRGMFLTGEVASWNVGAERFMAALEVQRKKGLNSHLQSLTSYLDTSQPIGISQEYWALIPKDLGPGRDTKR
jgi:hypothetical protein